MNGLYKTLMKFVKRKKKKERSKRRNTVINHQRCQVLLKCLLLEYQGSKIYYYILMVGKLISRPFLRIGIFSTLLYLLFMMLDDTRCGLDASSLHRTASMDNYIAKKFELLSCHRDALAFLEQSKNKAEKL